MFLRYRLCPLRVTSTLLEMNKRPLLITLAAIMLILSSAHTSAADDDTTWQAGVAQVNITPTEPIWMSGYGSRDKPATGKLTDLWVKALVLQDASGNKVVLLTADLVGIDGQFAEQVCEEIHNQFGFTRDQIAICCSHTHTGPVVERNLYTLHYLQLNPAQQASIRKYTENLKQKFVQAVKRASAELAECTLEWGNGHATFAVNRRENKPYGDVPQRRFHDKLNGPIDHDVPVLAVRDKQGQLKTVVFGYACHATVLNSYQWSGDYPGYAQIELEQRYPGCVAMFWAGCGADQNPLPRQSVELARHYGRRLALAVEAVLLTSKLEPISSQIDTSYEQIDLPLDTLPTAEELQQAVKSSNRYESARARMLLEKIDTEGSLSPTYPYPIGIWKLGEQVEWVLLGGEVVVDYALRLKSELHGRRTWVAGYANDVMAYVPSRRVLREGGYEGGTSMVYYGLPAHWHPDAERMIAEEVHRQARKK